MCSRVLGDGRCSLWLTTLKRLFKNSTSFIHPLLLSFPWILTWGKYVFLHVLQVVSVRTNVWVSVSGHVLDLLLQPPGNMCVTCQSESMWGDSRTMCGSVPVSEWTQTPCGRAVNNNTDLSTAEFIRHVRPPAALQAPPPAALQAPPDSRGGQKES